MGILQREHVSFAFRITVAFFKRFYLFMRHTQREAETQAEGEAVSSQGANVRLLTMLSTILVYP